MLKTTQITMIRYSDLFEAIAEASGLDIEGVFDALSSNNWLIEEAQAWECFAPADELRESMGSVVDFVTKDQIVKAIQGLFEGIDHVLFV